MRTGGEGDALRLQEGRPVGGSGLHLTVVAEALRMRLNAIAVQRLRGVLTERVDETLAAVLGPARLRREDRLYVGHGEDLGRPLQVRCHVGLPVACEERMGGVVIHSRPHNLRPVELGLAEAQRGVCRIVLLTEQPRALGHPLMHGHHLSRLVDGAARRLEVSALRLSLRFLRLLLLLL